MSSPPAPPSSATQLHHILRPWSQLLDPSAISIPISLSEATQRITQNLNYFLPNYALIVLIILFLSLIYHPLSIIVFLVVFALWVFLYFFRDQPLTLFDFPVDDRLVLAGLSLVTLLALIWAKVWLNVIVSLGIGALIVCCHAALRAPEDVADSPYGALLNVVDDDPRGTYASV